MKRMRTTKRSGNSSYILNRELRRAGAGSIVRSQSSTLRRGCSQSFGLAGPKSATFNVQHVCRKSFSEYRPDVEFFFLDSAASVSDLSSLPADKGLKGREARLQRVMEIQHLWCHFSSTRAVVGNAFDTFQPSVTSKSGSA